MKSNKRQRDFPRDVKDHLELALAVYRDAWAMCSTVPPDLRDEMTISARVKAEGMSFLTITLPDFAKSFEQALAVGHIDSLSFPRWRRNGAIPEFLQGMLNRLFNQGTGRLNANSQSPTLVAAVRQVCMLYKKVGLSCSPEREARALENFASTEASNSVFAPCEDALRYFGSVAHCLWDSMLVRLRISELVPGHGPGAVAERLLGNQKFVWRTWHERLEPFFPFVGTAYPCGVAADEEWRVEEVTFLSEDQELPSRVVLVPKTLKAPRVIAIEPAAAQYAQQSLKSWLYEAIESYWLTRGHVNFTDQSINQFLARTSSVNGYYSTIDMSDASDRVLNTFVLKMFENHGDLNDAIQASRTRVAELPDGRKIGPLAKFASMGSALCFPVEAMFFYTCSVAARLRKHDLPATQANCFKVSRDLYVYGDDLVVPTWDVEAILDYLHENHCKVNSAKTFTSGNFRESCGTDAFLGSEVTPTYIRKLRPQNRQQVAEALSLVSSMNAFFLKGYHRTASLLLAHAERILGPLPRIKSTEVGYLGRLDPRATDVVERRFNFDTQSVEVRAWVVQPVDSSDIVDGYPLLTKVLLGLEGQPSEPVHLRGRHTPWRKSARGDVLPNERTVQRGAATLKLRWVPVR